MAKAGEAEAQVVAAALERLARLMRAEEHQDGLNPAQWEALRYLARANRFSNSPGALTRYLGATKGTVSQTIIALERKGFVEKAARDGEKRSVSLTLAEKGRAALAGDPWARLQAAAAGLGEKTRRRMAKGARELLEAELERGGHAAFGPCAGCRYFRERGMEDDARGPHQCMLFGAPLSKAETALICAEHAAG
jgi:DNA-binding MarR family transcriptional regulator